MQPQLQHHRTPRRWSLAWLALLLAQPLAAQGPTIGLKVGASQSSRAVRFGGMGTERSPAREAPTISLAAAFPLRGPVGLQVELAHVSKGETFPGGSLLRSNYLEVPLLLRVRPTGARALLPVALLGIAPAYELSCNGLATLPTVGFSQPVVRERDCSGDRHTRYDFGLVGGIGVELPMRRAAFTAEVRYTHGLQDLYPRFEFVRGYNRSLSVLFGVRSGGGR